MNKIKSLFVLLLLSVNGFSQDTIVNHLTNEVRVIDKVLHYEMIYHFKKSNINVKHGFSKLIIDLPNKQREIIIVNYKNGEKHGKYKLFINDTLSDVYRFKNGELNGRFKKCIGKQLILKGRYRQNKRIGLWKYYSEINGKLIAKGKYSGQSINVTYQKDSIILMFSRGDKMSVSLTDNELINKICNDYSVKLLDGNNFLRKGTWYYYRDNKTLQKLVYAQNGIVIKRKPEKDDEYPYKINW